MPLSSTQPGTDTERRLRTPDWYRSATRWTQLTLAENDPVAFDPAFWIDVFRRTRSNATCLSAGGYIAYYPSQVPLHYVSRYLGDTDPFGTLVDGARKLGMHVMARVDPHAIHQAAADAHPEWIAVDRDGNPRRHWAYPDVWVTCAYGDYNNRFMPEVVKEITRDYDIDAVFANRWQGHGVCYCESCRNRFAAASGYDLPVSSEPDDPVWQAWIGWRRDVLTRMIVDWDDAVRAIRPHASFIPNMGGASLMEFDIDVIRKHCPFIVVDDQGRRGVEPLWMAGRNGKRVRATFPDRPVILITSIGPEEAHRWKDSVTSGAEIQGWIGNGIAHGMKPWFTKFNGVVPDTRWVPPLSEAFAIDADLEATLADTVPSANIAVIDPTTTIRHWPNETRSIVEADDLGVYHALVEAGLPFEFVSDETLTSERLDAFKVIVLSNATCLSDKQCAALRAYVERGGSLVAGFETSTRDEHGNLRDDFGLADVFGASRTGPTRGPLKNTYVALNGEHPVNAGYDGAARIMGGTYVVPVRANRDIDAPFLFVPDFPDLPMEEVYPRTEPSEPALIARESAGGGRTVYIPWNLGAIFWEVLAVDHGRLIANAIRWAMRDTPEVLIESDAVFDVAVRRGPNALAVLVFNLTNPAMLKGPTRRIMPAGPVQVSIAMPTAARSGSARLLVAGEPITGRVEGGRFVARIDSVQLLEVLHITWDAVTATDARAGADAETGADAGADVSTGASEE